MAGSRKSGDVVVGGDGSKDIMRRRTGIIEACLCCYISNSKNTSLKIDAEVIINQNPLSDDQLKKHPVKEAEAAAGSYRDSWCQQKLNILLPTLILLICVSEGVTAFPWTQMC